MILSGRRLFLQPSSVSRSAFPLPRGLACFSSIVSACPAPSPSWLVRTALCSQVPACDARKRRPLPASARALLHTTALLSVTPISSASSISFASPASPASPSSFASFASFATPVGRRGFASSAKRRHRRDRKEDRAGKRAEARRRATEANAARLEEQDVPLYLNHRPGYFRMLTAFAGAQTMYWCSFAQWQWSQADPEAIASAIEATNMAGSSLTSMVASMSSSLAYVGIGSSLLAFLFIRAYGAHLVARIETGRGGDAVEVATHGMLGALDTTVVPRAQLTLHSQSDDYYMFKIKPDASTFMLVAKDGAIRDFAQLEMVLAGKST